MARLVVWAKPDETHSDQAHAARKYKRGMVVDILEDGQFAGKDVEEGAWWRILEVPGPRSDWTNLLGADPQFFDNKSFGSKPSFPAKRINMVDLDAVEAGKMLTAADSIAIASVPTRKVVVHVNPDVLGADPDVLG